MQLTRFDRWVLEEYVHETHIYTLSPPVSIPPNVREVPLPDTPGRRFQHHFIASNGRSGDELCKILRTNGQMFSTQIIDRDAWYIPYIAPPGRSLTWRIVSIIFICIASIAALIFLKQLWDNPEVRKMLSDSLKTLKG